MSLSTRIALGVAVVLMLTLVGLGAAMTRVTSATLTREIDDRLVTSVERAEGLPGLWDERRVRRDRNDDGSTDERVGDAADFGPDVSGRNVALYIVGPGGQVLLEQPSGFPNAPDPPPRLPPIPGPVARAMEGTIVTLPAIDDSLRYRVLLRPGPGGTTFVTAASLRPVEQAVNSLVRALVVARGRWIPGARRGITGELVGDSARTASGRPYGRDRGGDCRRRPQPAGA